MGASRPQTVGLPMYDPPELHAAVDAWWSGLARAFRAEGVANVPDGLDRSLSIEALWGAPDLLFTQTCGYPLTGAWASRLQYLATPRYAAAGCEGSNYCSWIVVAADSRVGRVEDLRGARCSINGRVSHSGYNALRALIAPLARDGRFFGSVSVSGGHAESLTQLARGEVDVAAIDCVSYALFRRCRPHAVEATRIIGRTTQAPGLPYAVRIEASAELCQRLRAALLRAFSDPAFSALRAELLIVGLDFLPAGAYRCMSEMETEAKRQRYVELD
jgi:ABC-type phosphate/phosphonate transport system substrate-binding protein